MKGRTRSLVLVAIAILSLGATASQATVLNNSVGLTSPGHVITFDEVALPDNAPLNTAYAGYGVAGFSNLFTSPYHSGLPNTSGTTATNFQYEVLPTYSPITISFETAVTDAAFVLVTNYSSSPSIIQSFLNGTLVETASVYTSTGNPYDFYGFTDSLFDKIVITPEDYVNGAAVVDNLQFTSAAPVPEPSTVLLLGVGLAGAGLFRKGARMRRRGAAE